DFRRQQWRSFLRGKKWFAERFVEIVAAFEIFTAIGLGFAKQFTLDQVENQFAEVLTTADAPLFEDAHSHGPKLGQGVFTDSLEQLPAGDVPHRALALFADNFLSVIQRFTQELISIPVITRI